MYQKNYQKKIERQIFIFSQNIYHKKKSPLRGEFFYSSFQFFNAKPSTLLFVLTTADA